MKLIYLCGPIGGLTAEDATRGWRWDATDMLADIGLQGVTPMRGKAVLFGSGILGAAGRPDLGPMLTEQAIFKRDCNDVRRCTSLQSRLKDSPRVSTGSVWELGFSTALNKPIVVVPDPNHDHLFVRQSATALAHDLYEAIECLTLILGEY